MLPSMVFGIAMVVGTSVSNDIAFLYIFDVLYNKRKLNMAININRKVEQNGVSKSSCALNIAQNVRLRYNTPTDHGLT